MIASMHPDTQVLVEPGVWQKLHALPVYLQALLHGKHGEVPLHPGRDVQILPIRQLPAKKGLSSVDGQARLLHDLASIELQAMELGVRTLVEFPEAPASMREQLAEITYEEGEHLRLCLQGLEALDRPWGFFPTHIGLWQCVGKEDSLLDRLLIVHRYLEGSGLDASHTLQRRLAGVQAREARQVLDVIARDELAHVSFGSHWYHTLLREAGLDPADDFCSRLEKLSERVPRRLEPINAELRVRAGFTESEIQKLQEFRGRML